MAAPLRNKLTITTTNTTMTYSGSFVLDEGADGVSRSFLLATIVNNATVATTNFVIQTKAYLATACPFVSMLGGADFASTSDDNMKKSFSDSLQGPQALGSSNSASVLVRIGPAYAVRFGLQLAGSGSVDIYAGTAAE